MKTINILLSIPLILCGCQNQTVLHSGDCGSFMVSEVLRYGGREVTTNPAPKLNTTWTSRSDKNGFTLVLRDCNFVDIEQILTNTFGMPSRTGTNAIGGMYGLYSPAHIGVAIHFFSSPNNGVQVNCVKPSNEMNMIEHLPK